MYLCENGRKYRCAMISTLKVALCSTVSLSVLLPSSGFANWIINNGSDAYVSIGGTTGTVTGTGSAIIGSGDLRFVLNQILNDQAQFSSPVTQSITFDPSVESVTLTNFPPPINLFRLDPITITGSQTIIDGGGFRPFYLTQGTVTLQNLIIQNGVAKGGDATDGGGGGMGAGGAIFVDAASIILNNISINSCSAVSGTVDLTSSDYKGGGGGLGGTGGNTAIFSPNNAGGGGGYCGNGGAGLTNDYFSGGGGSLGNGGIAEYGICRTSFSTYCDYRNVSFKSRFDRV
jgi:hypothetical protein